MNTKSGLKTFGIYSLENKYCGCQIRRYAGGRVITIGCQVHSNQIEFICPVCGGKKQSRKQLKECKWSHAI